MSIVSIVQCLACIAVISERAGPDPRPVHPIVPHLRRHSSTWPRPEHGKQRVEGRRYLSDRSFVLARFKTRKGFVPNALEPGTEIRIIARSQANFPPVIAKELAERLEMPRVAVHFEAK